MYKRLVKAEKKGGEMRANKGRRRGACINIISKGTFKSCAASWTDLVKNTAVVRGNIVGIEEDTLLY